MIYNLIIKYFVFIPVIFIFVISCASGPSSLSKHIEKIDVPETALTETKEISYDRGSIWSDDGHNSNLFSDRKASKVGDVITIVVQETASAKKAASTKASKDSSMESSASALFGFEKAVQLANPNFNPEGLLKTSHKDAFDGKGNTSRSGNFQTTLSAIVIKVYPNHNLLIRGSREITLNEEEQIITLSGIVRPEDLTYQNTVSSTKIANAKITYTGKGVIADKQHPGWVTRIIAWIWPF